MINPTIYTANVEHYMKQAEAAIDSVREAHRKVCPNRARGLLCSPQCKDDQRDMWIAMLMGWMAFETEQMELAWKAMHDTKYADGAGI